MLPFINTIIYIERFDKTIESFLKQKISYWDQLYKRSTFANQVIANFLNVAAIPLIARSLKPTLGEFPKSKKHSFSSKMILRSYALALTWSPLDATVTSSIDFTGVNYLIVAPIMLSIAIAAIYADVGISFLRYRKIKFTPTVGLQHAGTVTIKKKLLKLGIFISVFVGLASLVQSCLNQSFLISIVIVLPVYSLIWSLAVRKPKRYMSLIAGNWNNHTRGLSKYFFMFLSAGLFVKMAVASGAMELLQNFYEPFVDVPVYFYLLTAAFFLITSLVGFHPLIALAVYAASLEPVIAELSIVPFTVVLIACSIASVMYSPFNLSVSVLANELKINPYRITSWNLAFAMLYVGFSITVAVVLNSVI
ncbi:hypothetical protein SD71_10470 [Cohnella kolymensis]|uniref:Uncharacterized protein n=1 Tax=Cohnella kolymensis TaxID=1590652 RepID=A0ABR5A444_9BACL|nr:hypothetical protein [Cohnella kolymensis]KIL35821.1 hypothetical protein SD71_10470 [Cohnella kolymensis]